MRARGCGLNRANVSGGNCSRDSTRTPRLIVWKPLRQRVLSGAPSRLRRAKPRASWTMKRGLMPCVQAGMQLPLPLHTSAQRIAASLPSPPVIRSTIAPAVSLGSAVGEPGRLDHRAGAKAVAAARAGVGDRLGALIRKTLEKIRRLCRYRPASSRRFSAVQRPSKPALAWHDTRNLAARPAPRIAE